MADGVTPLELVDELDGDDVDPSSDVLDAAFTHKSTTSRPVDTADTDLLRESIASVMGPPTKRQRTNPPNEASAHLIVPEEPSRTVPTSHPTTNTDEVEMWIHPATVPNTAGLDDDPVLATNPDLPGDRPLPIPITQDDDEPDSVDLSNGVSRQLTSVAGDANDEDELFDCISGHEWNNGALFLELLWKTNKTSVQPFSIVQQDLPQATANYILKNKVGSADGRYPIGRYMHWARSFNQEVKRILQF